MIQSIHVFGTGVLRLRAMLALVFCLALFLCVGCKVSDKGTTLGNLPPTVAISSAPNDSAVANHYLTLKWAGDDPDGYVVGFHFWIDGALITYTAANETTMAFSSPIDSGRSLHVISVAAVDDDGLESAVATRAFYTRNYRPALAFDDDHSPREGATATAGFRITLSASDPNPSRFYYSMRVDSGEWSPWVDENVFLIADPKLHRTDEDTSAVNLDDDRDGAVDEELENGLDDDGDGAIDEDTRGLYSDATAVFSNETLSTGPHTIHAKVKDAGDAESAVISRTLNINPDLRAVMDDDVIGQYGTDAVYRDGSVYYKPFADISTELAFSAEFAVGVAGELEAYRYQRGDSAWSPWSRNNSIAFPALARGEHAFRFQGRDLAGNVTNEIHYTLRLLSQTLSRDILIVDATAHSALTDSTAVNAFYQRMFAGYDYNTIDYVARGGTPQERYLSPFDLTNVGLVMWHNESVDTTHLTLSTRVLRDYLISGGRVIISGWDWPRSLASDAPGGDSARFFSPGSFGYDYLKLISAKRPTGTQEVRALTIGFDGVEPYNISARIDTARLHSTFRQSRGRISRCWVFQQQGQCEVVATMAVYNPADPWHASYAGRTNVYLFDRSFRFAAFGIPLYFCDIDSADALMDIIIPHMLVGL